MIATTVRLPSHLSIYYIVPHRNLMSEGVIISTGRGWNVRNCDYFVTVLLRNIIIILYRTSNADVNIVSSRRRELERYINNRAKEKPLVSRFVSVCACVFIYYIVIICLSVKSRRVIWAQTLIFLVISVCVVCVYTIYKLWNFSSRTYNIFLKYIYLYM